MMERMFKGVVMKRNLTDISFMILNMKRAANSISELQRRVSFPVYQEPADRDIMGLLGGSKDDFLIFDRCGLLAYHLKWPRNYLLFPFVRNALIKEYTNKGSKCKRHCPIKTTTTATQSTTNRIITAQEILPSYSSESVKSRPRSDATTTSSPPATRDLTLIQQEETL
ncbi:selenoprotein Pb-like [Stylophora pistillata]|nr:selenoprotein Pb-like [Stylophora pistillata]